MNIREMIAKVRRGRPATDVVVEVLAENAANPAAAIDKFLLDFWQTSNSSLAYTAWLETNAAKIARSQYTERLAERKGFKAASKKDLQRLADMNNAKSGKETTGQDLLRIIKGGGRADDKMEKINSLLDGYGVEVIRGDSYAVAEYINMGDTYNTTLLYDVNEDEFYVTTWGDWVEAFSEMYDIQ